MSCHYAKDQAHTRTANTARTTTTRTHTNHVSRSCKTRHKGNGIKKEKPYIYPHTMNRLDSLIRCLGWAALTYSWLRINFTFSAAIIQAIENHNDAIRQEVLQELEAEDTDSEPEQSEDES